MTREEAKKYISDNLGFMKNEIDTDIVDELIDKIYNELDKRICNNCKYFRTDYAPTCDLGVSSGKLFGNDIVDLGFGCNKFEKKEEK